MAADPSRTALQPPDAPVAPVHPRLAQSAGLKVVLMLRRIVDPAAVPPLLDAHLEWMIAQEKKGRILLSGPIAGKEGSDLRGATVIRADTLEEADEIVRSDPLVAAGAISFDLHAWSLFEGAIQATLTLSDSRVKFG